MKRYIKTLGLIITSQVLASALPMVQAQEGYPFIHDPSNIMECDGKYYTFGTGGGGLMSSDGWHWDTGAERPGGGAAPDVLKIGDRYLVAYCGTGGGLNGGHAGRVVTMWNKTLDPKSPDFHFTEPIEVANSDGFEDCDAIDPGLLLDPTTGRLWMSYGTYFGNIRIVELDPATGKRMAGNKAVDVAIDCEATDLIYRNGWYYLLGTHGTCCDGVNSTYNIVVGRSRSVLGPYVDNVGRDMMHGGGRMVLAAGYRQTGAGHFGRYEVEPGVEKMSCHFEADLDRGGYSVLAIRPLLWENGWPVAGEPFQEGVYEIESVRRGYALELAVDFKRHADERHPWFRKAKDEPLAPIPDQTLEEVQGMWPKGNIAVRCGDYLFRPHQKWEVRPVKAEELPGPDSLKRTGFLGGAYCKIVIAGTNRALAATANAEVETVAQFTGAPEQLWRIDQLTDGTFRIMPQQVPGHTEPLALVSLGDSSPTLAPFDMNSDNSKWKFSKR